ncbi:hypothetical protein UFOVP39_68 [uncultured Caudovirales phage]|uniref:Uncharacterized protein n=1 Tax=uncultured Caudovirales phage TaxID=2100421 RepID=A0A6J5T7A0_9CAUD|nr:hypothetical protein UFOVP39_68 [uncultured Caudovirales phage]
MAIPLPPAPNAAAPGDFVWVDWYNKLQKILSVTGSIAWNLIDFKSSKLTDIVNRDHNDLLAIQGGTATEHYHLNNAQYVIATQAASATVSGYLTSADWSTFNGKQPAGAYLTAVTSNSPLTGAGTAASHLSMPAATTSVNGYLTSTDWTTFNNKQPAGTYVTSVAGTTGRITSSGGTTPAIDLASGIATAGTTGSSTLIPVVTIDTYGRVTSITTASNPQGTVTSVTGTAPVVSSGGTTPAISMAAATTSVSGYLTSTDWNTFNNKGSGTVTSVTGTAPVVSSGGATPAISMAAATTSVSGYLTSTDWNTFNGKQAAGTYVTSLTVTGANGFAGSFTSGATPALTVSTSITGVLKGNGTAISAAVANTDYVPLSTVLIKTADYTITNTDMWIINNKTGSALTLTFPAASSWTGRAITVKNMQAQLVNSASSNIVPIDSTTAGTAILLGVVGNWAKLVSDGTNWVIMQAASNNNLLLE